MACMQAKRDWKEMETKKDDIRRLSSKCVGLKALLLQHAPGNQVRFDGGGGGYLLSAYPLYIPDF